MYKALLRIHFVLKKKIHCFLKKKKIFFLLKLDKPYKEIKTFLIISHFPLVEISALKQNVFLDKFLVDIFPVDPQKYGNPGPDPDSQDN